MPNVDVNGTVVNFPDDLNPEQLNQAVSKAASQMGGEKPGLVQRGWEALTVPEKIANKAALGARMATQIIPESYTGNLGRDILFNTPKKLAETATDFASKVGPPLVSRGSLVTQAALPVLGALRPAASILRKAAFGAGEELSMAAKAKGALEAGYKDASTILAGKGAAKPFYQAANAELPSMVQDAAGMNPFKGMLENKEIVSKARQMISDGETLLPTDALRARKAVDALHGSKLFSQEALLELRGELDQVAKQSENVAKADPLFQKGMRGQAMRSLFPQNLRGGTSRFSVGVGTALANMGKIGKALSLGLSPAVWGTGATGLGLAERNIITPILNDPKKAALVYSILKQKLEPSQESPE